eukprot:3094558-Rhodomonas_salina.2
MLDRMVVTAVEAELPFGFERQALIRIARGKDELVLRIAEATSIEHVDLETADFFAIYALSQLNSLMLRQACLFIRWCLSALAVLFEFDTVPVSEEGTAEELPDPFRKSHRRFEKAGLLIQIDTVTLDDFLDWAKLEFTDEMRDA